MDLWLGFVICYTYVCRTTMYSFGPTFLLFLRCFGGVFHYSVVLFMCTLWKHLLEEI